MNLIKMHGYFHPSQVKKTIHIIGCGAVGSTIAENLARCGLTDFVLYDDDIVESHNIVNQMFREKDIGQKKVDALADILCEINPEIKDKIKLVPERYESQPLSGYVFLCVDSIETRKKIATQHKFNPNIILMSDVRLSLTDAQHYMCVWNDPQMVKDFISTMNFTDAEALAETPQTACNVTLSVCTVIRIICAIAVSNFMNYIISDGTNVKRSAFIDIQNIVLDAFAK